jgi:RNA recognition motif-containing protein
LLIIQFTEDDLRKEFEKFGPIESVSLKQKDTFSFAFIEYKETKDAE